MQQAQSRTFTWSFAMTLAAIGGFAAAVGVVFGWWSVAAYRESEIFGRELVEEAMLFGTAHWCGTVALVIGAAVALLAVAGVLVHGDGARRVAGISALSGGSFVMAAAALGFGQAAGVAQAQVGAPGLGVEGSAGGGLFFSAAGGLVVAVAGFLARRAPES